MVDKIPVFDGRPIIPETPTPIPEGTVLVTVDSSVYNLLSEDEKKIYKLGMECGAWSMLEALKERGILI